MFDPDRFLSGDQAYASEIVRKHHGFVLFVCRSFANTDAGAADLAQETWKNVVASARSFGGRGPFRAWLHRVATNTCLSHVRSSKSKQEGREKYVLEALSGRTHVDSSPQRLVERGEVRRSIHQALTLLTDSERAAVTLRVLEGLTSAESADAMGVSTATVRSHLRHGINHLKRILEEPDNDLSRHRAAR